MSLYLFEIVPAASDRASARALIAAVDEAASSVSAAVLESQVTSGHGRVFTVVEHDGGPDEVRLVGAEIEDIRGLRGSADYLVEWDIPAEIDMETYLTRKKANSPKYAQVPEVSFLRTYVREDTVKCLCFYDAPDEETVVKAREAVSTPIDRLHKLSD